MADYSATYYTYLWSQVIAKDLWSAFDPANPLDPTPARRYRDLILRPGGSKHAARLLEVRPVGVRLERQLDVGRRVVAVPQDPAGVVAGAAVVGGG